MKFVKHIDFAFNAEKLIYVGMQEDECVIEIHLEDNYHIKNTYTTKVDCLRAFEEITEKINAV